MKALVVSNMYPSVKKPGYGVFVKNFVEEFSVFFELDLVVIKGGPPSKLVKLFKYIWFFFDVLFKGLLGNYDFIYVHYAAHSLLPIVFLRLFKRAPLFCNVHGEDIIPKSRLEKLIFRVVKGVISDSELLVVPSPFFERRARRLFPNASIFVSPSAGVDLKKFRPHFGKKEGTKKVTRFGYVSRIDEGKGWYTLIEAVSKARQKYSNLLFEVIIVGEGSQADELMSKIENENLSQIVSYAGPMPHDELPSFYSSLDFFVFPTELPESLGLVGIEALSCGVPALCSDMGGIRTYMKSGFNGYLFKPGSSSQLSNLIKTACCLEREKISELRENAIKTAIPYGRDVVAKNLYNRILRYFCG